MCVYVCLFVFVCLRACGRVSVQMHALARNRSFVSLRVFLCCIDMFSSVLHMSLRVSMHLLMLSEASTLTCDFLYAYL